MAHEVSDETLVGKKRNLKVENGRPLTVLDTREIRDAEIDDVLDDEAE